MLKDIEVTMICNNLLDIPQFKLPTPFTIRWYNKGDEEKWIKVNQLADKLNNFDRNVFYNEFKEDLHSLKERMFFIMNQTDQPVGTSTAWFDTNFLDTEYGRVHWVAIIPSMQGKGLAKPLMSILMNRFKVLGYSQVYLTTSAIRLPAISLYKKFGFIPFLKNDGDVQIWKEINEVLDKRKQIGAKKRIS